VVGDIKRRVDGEAVGLVLFQIIQRRDEDIVKVQDALQELIIQLNAERNAKNILLEKVSAQEKQIDSLTDEQKQAIADVYAYALKAAAVDPVFTTPITDSGILICPTRFPKATLYASRLSQTRPPSPSPISAAARSSPAPQPTGRRPVPAPKPPSAPGPGGAPPHPGPPRAGPAG